MGSIYEKNSGPKSRATVPLRGRAINGKIMTNIRVIYIVGTGLF
jgi:hypothetical protein